MRQILELIVEQILGGNSQDAEYISAVERGDMETAQKMVDNAAKKAGYVVGPVYHKTDKNFNIFDIFKSSKGAVWGPAIYASFNNDWRPSSLSNGRVVKGYVGGRVIDMTNPITSTDVEILSTLLNREIDSIPFISLEKRYGSVSEGLSAAGYSSAIHSGPGAMGKHIAIFSSTQIKSADPITKDDQGDVIPLSQRFDSSNPDIRY